MRAILQPELQNVSECSKIIRHVETAASLEAEAGRRRLIEVVKRNELHKFVVLPKRWIVERTLAWISRNRRLMRDFERYTRTVVAFIRLAMIKLMLRRLARSNACP